MDRVIGQFVFLSTFRYGIEYRWNIQIFVQSNNTLFDQLVRVKINLIDGFFINSRPKLLKFSLSEIIIEVIDLLFTPIVNFWQSVIIKHTVNEFYDLVAIGP